ncbi:MAG: hypothetical protein WBB69_08450 [Anaerolineales bacterium]
MTKLSPIRFWHLMVGTGFLLLSIGLVMIFLPPGLGNSDPFLIEFFEAKIEGSEMGLALIVLGLSCFLIGRKDLADLRTVQGFQDDLQKTSTLTAKLVADRVDKTFNGLLDQPTILTTVPDLDVGEIRRILKEIQNGNPGDQEISRIIHQAESGMELLEALEREGYSI